MATIETPDPSPKSPLTRQNFNRLAVDINARADDYFDEPYKAFLRRVARALATNDEVFYAIARADRMIEKKARRTKNAA